MASGPSQLISQRVTINLLKYISMSCHLIGKRYIIKEIFVRKIKKAPAVSVRFDGLTLTFHFVVQVRKELADLLLYALMVQYKYHICKE